MKKLFFLLLMVCSLQAFADVRLPAIIGDHMVLQQNSTVKIWGWCDPQEKISLKTGWDTATYTATGGPDAKFSIQLKTPFAGGPYTISINGRNSVVINDVLIGEVWLCSGQSNMEMSVSWGAKKYEPDVQAATNKSIRFFHIPHLTAQYPQDDLKAKWVVCNPEDMRRFSMVGYFFGQKLNQELGAPVGLINSSWGGTPAEVWTPQEAIVQNPELTEAATKLKEAAWWSVKPGYNYNAMIHPFINYAVAGVLWYQGEANVQTYATYSHLLSTMITSWRKAWGREFPFYFAQIAPFAGYGKDDASAFLREQQTKTLSVPNTGMVVTSDLVDNINDIHPQMKKEVGLRLANLALAEIYRKNIAGYKSPMYQGMKIEKGKIRLSFTNAEKGLVSKGGAPTEFYIAGADRKFVPASAKIVGNTVIVWNKEIKNPVAVRFGFTNAATPNLFNKEGLPVNLFRTDNWEVHIEQVARK